jgi:hypothetical protein
MESTNKAKATNWPSRLGLAIIILGNASGILYFIFGGRMSDGFEPDILIPPNPYGLLTLFCFACLGLIPVIIGIIKAKKSKGALGGFYLGLSAVLIEGTIISILAYLIFGPGGLFPL